MTAAGSEGKNGAYLAEGHLEGESEELVRGLKRREVGRSVEMQLRITDGF